MLSRAYVVAWLSAFLLTEAVEAPIYRRALGISWTRALSASALTHPFVWFVFPVLGRWLGLSWSSTVVVAEGFAWLAEAAYFRATSGASTRRALLVSFVANAASVAVGTMTRAISGWP